jgi:hypothetical protein
MILSNQAQSQAIKTAQSSLLNVNLTIENTTFVDTTVELFNYDHSMTTIYNPSVNQGEGYTFYPVVPSVEGDDPNAAYSLASTTAFYPNNDQDYTLGYKGIICGTLRSFKPQPPYGDPPDDFSSPGAVYFDKDGKLTYWFGSGTNDVDGYVTVQSDKNSYRQLFGVLGRTAIMCHMIKIQVLGSPPYIPITPGQIAQPLNFVQSNILGVNKNLPLAPGAQVNEDQYSDNIITFGVNKIINPKSGFTYKILGSTKVLFSLYFSCDPKVYNLQS